MRGCQEGLSDNARRLANGLKLRTKNKRACDECAISKSKCDHQKPCDRCRRKSLKCEKTRNGYQDPYGIYSIQNRISNETEVENIAPKHNMDNIVADSYMAPPLKAVWMNSTVGVSEPIPHEQGQAYLRQQQIGEVDNTRFTSLPSPPDDENAKTCVNVHNLFADCNLPDDEDSIALEADTASLYFASLGNFEYFFNPQS